VYYYWDRKWRRKFVTPTTNMRRPDDVLQEHWIGSVHYTLVNQMMASIKEGVPVRKHDWPDSFAYIREVTQLLEAEQILPWGATERLPSMFGLESEGALAAAWRILKSCLKRDSKPAKMPPQRVFIDQPYETSSTRLEHRHRKIS